ncbi:hypothetical protein QOT17_009210 [Balamuthia mandrillaris]
MEVKISYIRSQFKIWARLETLKGLSTRKTVTLLRQHLPTKVKITNVQACIQVTLVYPQVLSLQQCIVKTLTEKPSIWFDMWLSCDVWSLPVHLRHWLLVEGICLAPQLHDETLWCIDNKPVWNTSSPPKPQKKRKVLHSDKETISLEEAKGALESLKCFCFDDKKC